MNTPLENKITIVQEFIQSGLSQKEFAASKNMPLGRLQAWVRMPALKEALGESLSKRQKKRVPARSQKGSVRKSLAPTFHPPNLVEIIQAHDGDLEVSSSMLTLILPGGHSLSFTKLPPPAYLGSFLKELV